MRVYRCNNNKNLDGQKELKKVCRQKMGIRVIKISKISP